MTKIKEATICLLLTGAGLWLSSCADKTVNSASNNGPGVKKVEINFASILEYDDRVEINICPVKNTEFKKSIVSLTFDDGWKEIYENAIPILDQAHIKSTHYVNVRERREVNKFMSPEEIVFMERAGHEIGSHATNHKRFTELTDPEVHAELQESRNLLFKMGVKSVDTFAYPYGEYTDYSVELSRKSKYIAVRVAIPGMNDRRTDKFLLYGYQLENWMVFNPYLKRLVDRAEAENKWLILIFHQVTKPDYQFYTSPNDLRLLINYLVEKKMPIMTVRDVIKKCY